MDGMILQSFRGDIAITEVSLAEAEDNETPKWDRSPPYVPCRDFKGPLACE